jgi:tetratricopeptide (TPR) repeat protein
MARGQGRLASRSEISQQAAELLNAGRSNEARILLLKAMRESTTPEARAVYRLEVGDSYLWDGNYTQATRTYEEVLASDDARGVDSLTAWVHRGLALAEAFTGRTGRGASHFAQALKVPQAPNRALPDSIEALVLTGQREAAGRALDRMAASVGAQGEQYVHAFRALNFLLSGHCTDALAELSKASDPDRPIPRAIRARCAAKHGRLPEAMAVRDSVLRQPVPNPFTSTAIIARDVARKVR